jgi:uncharacterized membrane protein
VSGNHGNVSSQAGDSPQQPQTPLQPGLVPTATPTTGSPYNPLPQQQVLVLGTGDSWEGPFPPPEVLYEYEKILPGSFDRLLKMAERSQAGTIEALGRAQEFTRHDIRRGHYLGWATAVIAILAAVYCAHIKQPWVASAIVAVPVMAVAQILVGRHKEIKGSTPDQGGSGPENG